MYGHIILGFYLNSIISHYTVRYIKPFCVLKSVSNIVANHSDLRINLTASTCLGLGVNASLFHNSNHKPKPLDSNFNGLDAHLIRIHSGGSQPRHIVLEAN